MTDWLLRIVESMWSFATSPYGLATLLVLVVGVLAWLVWTSRVSAMRDTPAVEDIVLEALRLSAVCQREADAAAEALDGDTYRVWIDLCDNLSHAVAVATDPVLSDEDLRALAEQADRMAGVA